MKVMTNIIDSIAKIRGYIFVKECQYFNKRVTIGPGLKLYCKLEIQGEGKVSIGKNCIVSKIIGDSRHYVTIYTHGPTATISIGDNAMLFAARISSKHEIVIGDNFLIEESGIMDTDFHSISPDRREPLESKEKCHIRIGNRVSIGARSILCKGITIGDDVVIWPGSIINKSIPSGTSVCGNPPRAVK